MVAGDRNVKSSYLLSKRDALELFPMLKGDKLCGAIVYYDGNIVLFSYVEQLIQYSNESQVNRMTLV